MKFRFALVLLVIFVSPQSFSDGRKAWLYNAPESDEYIVRLRWIRPFPGTPLIAGEKVDFKVLGFYRNDLNVSGTATLVIQDEKDNLLTGRVKQTSTVLYGKTGNFELEEIFEIPDGINYLRVFIPFTPEGLNETIGEIAVTYPVIPRSN